MNFWNKEYNYNESYNYRWIIKLEYFNGLSECFYGYDQVSNNRNTFIKGFKNTIYKYDEKQIINNII